MSSVINRLASGRLVGAVRDVAVIQAITNGMRWRMAMQASGASPLDMLAVTVANDNIIAEFYTMRPERLIAEYGHLLRDTNVPQAVP